MSWKTCLGLLLSRLPGTLASPGSYSRTFSVIILLGKGQETSGKKEGIVMGGERMLRSSGQERAVLTSLPLTSCDRQPCL